MNGNKPYCQNWFGNWLICDQSLILIMSHKNLGFKILRSQIITEMLFKRGSTVARNAYYQASICTGQLSPFLLTQSRPSVVCLGSQKTELLCLSPLLHKDHSCLINQAVVMFSITSCQLSDPTFFFSQKWSPQGAPPLISFHLLSRRFRGHFLLCWP